MADCRTFVRGTIRFAGFSNIISAYHDLGLSSDEEVPAGSNTLKKILQSRLDATSVQKLNSEGTAIGNLISKVTDGYSCQDINDASFFRSIL